MVVVAVQGAPHKEHCYQRCYRGIVCQPVWPVFLAGNCRYWHATIPLLPCNSEHACRYQSPCQCCLSCLTFDFGPCTQESWPYWMPTVVSTFVWVYTRPFEFGNALSYCIVYMFLRLFVHFRNQTDIGASIEQNHSKLTRPEERYQFSATHTIERAGLQACGILVPAQ